MNNPQMRGTTSSFRVVNESRKSEGKDLKINETSKTIEQFEINREEIKDDEQYVVMERRNSDLKRFNNEDDQQMVQSLRIDQKSQFRPVYQTSDSYIINRNDDQQYQQIAQNLEEIHKDTIKQYRKQHNSKFEHTQNQTQEQNQLTSIHETNSPQSFGSPDNDNHSKLKQQNDVLKAHILSFSDQNHAFQVQHPHSKLGTPLDDHQADSQENRPLSPSLNMQNRRLLEIVGSSQTESSVLQSAPQHDKIDQKALNNMIDNEKDYVILQYEGILQQLNGEFHKLLQKTKDTEENLASKDHVIKTQARIIADKEQQQYQQEQINRQLTIQIQELLLELENLTNSKNQQKSINSEYSVDTTWKFEKEFLEHKIQSVQTKMEHMEQIENDLRDQLDITLTRVRAAEKLARQREEETFTITRENLALTRDIKNIKDLEFQLKQELQINNGQRVALENDIQDIKHQVSSAQIQMRQRDQEIDNLVRENRNLKGTIEIFQQSQNEGLQESNMMKEAITESEKIKMQMRNHIEMQDRDVKGLQQELKRLIHIQEQERQRVQGMEEHYKSEVQKLMNNQKVLNTSQNSWEKNSSRENMQYTQSKEQSFNENLTYRTDNTNLSSTMQFKNNYETQKPLQETHNTFYSPQRNQKYQTNLQSHYSPNTQEGENASKNTIAWPYLWGTQTQNKTPQHQSSQPHQTQKFFDQQKPKENTSTHNDLQNSIQRRKTVQDQNKSQLHDVLAWDQTATQNKQYGARSLERSTLQNSKSEKKLTNDSYQNYPPQRNQSIDQSQQWKQQQSPVKSSQPNQINRHGMSPFAVQQQHGEWDMQPAGMKSKVVSQSPLEARNKNTEQHVSHMQNSLCALQMDKERVENEYRKLTHPKNKQQIEKKQEMEVEIEIVNKNIQNLKQKLREMNAF